MDEPRNYNGTDDIFNTTDAPHRIKKTASPNPRDEFTGAVQPLQVKIPADLIQSLKLHAISSDKTMSELVLECLTSDATISKAWISTRTKRSA